MLCNTAPSRKERYPLVLAASDKSFWQDCTNQRIDVDLAEQEKNERQRDLSGQAVQLERHL